MRFSLIVSVRKLIYKEGLCISYESKPSEGTPIMKQSRYSASILFFTYFFSTYFVTRFFLIAMRKVYLNILRAKPGEVASITKMIL